MRLSDVMSHAGLAIYAEVAMVLFFAVFVGVLFRLYGPGRAKDLDRVARLPLDDAGPNPDAARPAAGADA